MKQKENESINEYVTRFRKVLRKVNEEANIPDAHQVRIFVNGIKGKYKPMLFSQTHANVNEAITRAKQIEVGYVAAEND